MKLQSLIEVLPQRSPHAPLARRLVLEGLTLTEKVHKAPPSPAGPPQSSHEHGNP